MKILWVSNSPIGPASQILGNEYNGTSGGWIQSEYEYLNIDNAKMYFLCSLPNVCKSEIIHKSNELGDVYCVKAPKLAYGLKAPRHLEVVISKIINEVQPDVIHIWGTETYISNIVSKCNTSIPKVIFIQGLLGVHKRYLGGYFSKKDNRKYYKGTSLKGNIKLAIREALFKRQAKIEKETIINCGNVIVDSDFARGYCSSLSPEIKCYNHSLLPNSIFSSHRWNYDEVNKHTIFTVYGGSAEKGLQQLLKAVSIVKRKYSDVKVLVPGNYNLNDDGTIHPLTNNAYEKILANIIEDLKLSDNVVFIGRQDVVGMASHISSSHIFVNPSCMEVHALSLREALTEGVPCISALCGSVCDFIKHGQNGFIYRYEEYETLALYIEKIFENSDLAKKLSDEAVSAMDYFKTGSLSLKDIYNELVAGR
jgi:L-malate glycosyltransferase